MRNQFVYFPVNLFQQYVAYYRFDIKCDLNLIYDDGFFLLCDMEYDDEIEMIYEGKILNRKIMNLRKELKLVPKDIIEIYYKIDNNDNEKLTNLINNQDKYLYPYLRQKIINVSECYKDIIYDSDFFDVFDTKIEILIVLV